MRYRYDTSRSPSLEWSGKAERVSFDVPALPLFSHETLSTEAILSGGRHRDDVIAYAHGEWKNRLILGDSLAVMSSLVEHEGLGGQVQMIFMDPPYGVKFGPNFQRFVGRRDVKHGEERDLTREPEMVQAYRDTWELGTHSYLTYLRDRFLVSRSLLAECGSLFVQIGEENLHRVRCLLDELFGEENFVALIPFVKTTGTSSARLGSVCDYLVWFAKDHERLRYHQLYQEKVLGEEGTTQYVWVELPDGTTRRLTREERADPSCIRGRVFAVSDVRSPGATAEGRDIELDGRRYSLPANSHWKTTYDGMQRLAAAGRLVPVGNTLMYKRYLDDFSLYPLTNVWRDTAITGFSDEKRYVVQSRRLVVERCLLMTTDPGDLVLDPTCGSGTTAHAAEHWGRRWITVDVSRVPIALARQRLLTATHPAFALRDGRPSGGFHYEVVPRVTLGSIAHGEAAEEIVRVDRPRVVRGVRVTGPFLVQGTGPAANRGDETPSLDPAFVDRMIETLRRCPVLRFGGGRELSLTGIRRAAGTVRIVAEATVEGALTAILLGEESFALGEDHVSEAIREAEARGYARLVAIAFAAEPAARRRLEESAVPALYVQATPDLLLGDLLKTMRSSQVFAVCGVAEFSVRELSESTFQVILDGLDVFDPVTMDARRLAGDDVPAWFLDADYDGNVFHVDQAFFPRTDAWADLRRALKEDVLHSPGNLSAPFAPGRHRRVAVKVVDDRGNELVSVKTL